MGRVTVRVGVCAVREIVFVVVGREEMVLAPVAVRVFVVVARERVLVARLFCAGRAVVAVALRVDWVAVVVARRLVGRDVFWTSPTAAALNSNGARHAIKRSLIPFILYLI